MASSPPASACTATTGRLEKCYRAFGFELDAEYDVVEAGMAWGKVKEQDFVGKEAHVRQRETEPAAVMCTLTVDNHSAADGRKRYMLGGEPILTRDGKPLTDAKGRRSFVTSAGAGPVDRQAHPDGLPPARARRRRRAAARSSTCASASRCRSRWRAPPRCSTRATSACARPRRCRRELLVCVKRVPLTGGRMVLTADEQAIETRHLGYTISPHEECGVEEAVRLFEQHGGEVTVLCLGPAEAEEQIRDTLATGAHRGILLDSGGVEWDPQATAAAIVGAIRGSARSTT